MVLCSREIRRASTDAVIVAKTAVNGTAVNGRARLQLGSDVRAVATALFSADDWHTRSSVSLPGPARARCARRALRAVGAISLR